MDTEAETQKFKWLLGALLFFVVSGYFSYRELKYLAFGHEATATVREVGRVNVRVSRYRSEERWSIALGYPDSSGQTQVERETLGRDADVPAVGQQFQVEYLSGELDSARPVGSRNYVAIVIFVASLGSV